MTRVRGYFLSRPAEVKDVPVAVAVATAMMEARADLQGMGQRDRRQVIRYRRSMSRNSPTIPPSL